ncbi:MAG: hypothetical protein ABII00_11020 [Elusimicrobiota bacterium]
MEAFNLAQLTKEMVVKSIRALGDPAQVAAGVLNGTLLARLKGRGLSNREVEEAVIETARGAMAGMVLMESSLPRGAAAILAILSKTARQAGVNEPLVVIAGIKGMADVRRFTTAETLDQISRRLEETRRGAGGVFDRSRAEHQSVQSQPAYRSPG